MNSPCEISDLLVFSHMRWECFSPRQKKQLSFYAQYRRVYIIEESIIGITKEPRLQTKLIQENIFVIIPYLPKDLTGTASDEVMKVMLADLLKNENIQNFTILYYNSTFLNYSKHLNSAFQIFDYMEVQGTFNEIELMDNADLVFTSSPLFFEENNLFQTNIHLIPLSVDFEMFSQSRSLMPEPEDQNLIPHPRIGYCGLIDQNFDIGLLKKMAELRPEFEFILMGPLKGIEKQSLLIKPNIHYLGEKNYQDLPQYFSGWDCAFIPQISNIPEFLASGKPVVSTSIFDHIHPYSDAKLIYIADHPEHFVECIEMAINECNYDPEWLERVDQFLEGKSWSATFQIMAELEKAAKIKPNMVSAPAYLDSALISIGIV